MLGKFEKGQLNKFEGLNLDQRRRMLSNVVSTLALFAKNQVNINPATNSLYLILSRLAVLFDEETALAAGLNVENIKRSEPDFFLDVDLQMDYADESFTLIADELISFGNIGEEEKDFLLKISKYCVALVREINSK